MENIGGRTLMNRGMFFAVFTLLAVVIASGSLGLAQGSGDRAIDQAQRAVREQITSREVGRNLIAHFNSDARTEFKSNAEVRVRGTGVFSRNNDGKSRSFSYEANVNNRNRNVSDIRYDWRGDWYSSGGSYVTNRLTGAYRLNQSRSDNPATVADRVARNLPGGDRQRLRNSVMRRLEAPESLAIERRGRAITIASSRAAQVTFEADGREQTEQSRNGRSMRTKATLNGERLVVSSEGDRSIDYQIIFEPIDNGRRLRVTRRITDEGLRQQVVANSVYEKTSDVAQLDIYSGVRDNYPPAGASGGNFVVPDGTQLVAVLNDNLSTKQARDGDRFTLTVRSPSQYDGASIEGHVAQVNRSGQISGRAEMSLEFDRIRLRDGRASNFAGYIESVRTTSGETVRVDNEGRVQDESGQTGRTVTRAGIGAAIGAVIGAIAGGGKGAAIGAAVGAGAGAGSVFIQGREDLDLMSGAEFTIRASAAR
jgi:YmgG-like glycine-zipper protein